MGETKALVLAAGLGTRLRPLTDSIAKCLIPIAGRPLLEYWLIALADAGIRKVLINTHHLRETVSEYAARVNRRGGQMIIEAFEPALLGSAGTVSRHRDFAEDADDLVLIYADNFSDVDLSALLRYHRSHGEPVTMMLFHAADPRACGIVELDDEDVITRFEEKPQQPTSDLANAGVYVASRTAFREMADAGGFDLGRDVLPRFVGRMKGWVHEGYHVDVGTTEALARTNHDAPRINARRLMGGDGLRPAVFLDQDGVLLEHVHSLSSVDDVRLTHGAADAVIALRRAGFACVVVSNQSAVDRGLVTADRVAAVNERMCRLFAAEGAVFDAVYSCLVAPAGTDSTNVEHPDRNPGPLHRGARDLKLDLTRSWKIGASVGDVLAGINAGCRGSILVGTSRGSSALGRDSAIRYDTAPDLAAAAHLVIEAPVAA